MIERGVYPFLSNHDYHADGAISRSSILHFLDNPYCYYAKKLSAHRPVKQPTDAMRFGSAFHTFILENEKFGDEYALEPPRVMLKYDGEALYRAYKKECDELQHSKKIVLNCEEYNLLTAMRDALQKNKKAMELIEGNIVECSHFWEDPHTGLMCKARPDILSQNYVIDLKTIVSASPHYFQRAMSDGSYHIQAAMIRDAIRELGDRDISTFINICVEKTYPYQIGIYIISEEALETGREEYKNALLGIKNCMEINDWPGYAIQTIDLPKWRK